MFSDASFWIISIPIILLTISIHEFSHAKVADTLGDPTPRWAGRLSLNPLSHIDPIGLLMLIIVRFGWAKPVPINQNNFKHPQAGMAIVGMAGPISNMLVAWVCSIFLKNIPWGPAGGDSLGYQILLFAVWINVALAVFNLIPIPPLDGSRVLHAILPFEQAEAMDRIEPYGFFILIAILFFPATQNLLYNAIQTVVGLFL